jgi:hypothetical protein
MAHRITHEIIGRLREKQTNPGAAAQAFFGEQNVGPARSTAQSEVSCADLPVGELLRNLHSYRFGLGLRKTRRRTIRGINHMTTANCDLGRI